MSFCSRAHLLKILFNFEDVSGVHDMPGYYPHDDDRGGLRVIRDTESLDASYERYLRSAVLVIFYFLKLLIKYSIVSFMVLIGIAFSRVQQLGSIYLILCLFISMDRIHNWSSEFLFLKLMAK